FAVNEVQREALLANKKRLGIEEEVQPERKHRKRFKGPNPLSCKKKKKKQQQPPPQPISSGSMPNNVEPELKPKRKRKRTKIPQHIKEHFREMLNNKDK
ncbi:Protein of unknown function, partial [Gryllus bimaculatus]